MGAIKKKPAKKEVKKEVLDKALEYVTAKYGLDKSYVLTGFKLGKNSIQIGVANKEVECVFSIVDKDVIDDLLYNDETEE